MILYYVHDPMCSWCWGFRPTWERIRNTILQDEDKKVEIKTILGGLAADTDTAMPESMQLEIAGYWRKIQQHIPNTKFNFDFWEECIPKRSTYPACRAIIAARKQNLDIELDMIEAIQKAYYLNAQNPSEIDTLITLAESLGLNVGEFTADLNAKETQAQLKREAIFARKIGAQGFPSMILGKDGSYTYVPLNYNDPADALLFIQRYSQ